MRSIRLCSWRLPKPEPGSKMIEACARWCSQVKVVPFAPDSMSRESLPWPPAAASCHLPISPRHGVSNWAQHIVWLWRELPVPVIAAVHGIAFGGGFQLALGADLRYVAPDTLLSVTETKWGLVPDMAGTQLMRHLAREDVVRELTYTARIFSAEEALSYGFATRLVEDPRAAAMATARDIAGRSPDAIRAAKRLLNKAVACEARAGLVAETTEQYCLIGRPNHVEALKANLEKRPPRFTDPAA